jgi:glyoxylase-like metal-dependent hydrolase (beta-lactamase superfamily II)
VLVHPRGAPHIIDPSKLIAGTLAVYGDEAYARLYGDIIAVPKERLCAVQDGDRRAVGKRTFEFMHTPGHALHHLCILDRDAAAVFSGDTFGVSYREFDNANGEFVMATTTPTQFDPAQLHCSVDRILQARPRNIYMTHYSRVTRIERLGADMHADIDRFAAIARESADDADPAAAIRARMFDYLGERLARHGYTGADTEMHRLLDTDVRLNADGLIAWLSRAAA